MQPEVGRRSQQRRRIEDDTGRPLRALLLDLSYRQGLSQLEIAERLGVPVGTVASWIQRQGIQAWQLAAERAEELLASEVAS
jgi:transposase